MVQAAMRRDWPTDERVARMLADALDALNLEGTAAVRTIRSVDDGTRFLEFVALPIENVVPDLFISTPLPGRRRRFRTPRRSCRSVGRYLGT